MSYTQDAKNSVVLTVFDIDRRKKFFFTKIVSVDLLCNFVLINFMLIVKAFASK